MENGKIHGKHHDTTHGKCMENLGKNSRKIYVKPLQTPGKLIENNWFTIMMRAPLKKCTLGVGDGYTFADLKL